MAYSAVGLPLTGSGDSTASVAADIVSGNSYQAIKIFDGTEGSTSPVGAPATTPGSGDRGLVVRPIASTAFSQAAVIGSGGTTVNTVGSVALLAGSTANTVGAVAQGPGGTTANVWNVDGYAFTSANTSRTTVNTSVDASVVAASSNTRRILIQNLTTVDVALGLSTAAVTTALANVAIVLSGRQVAGGGSWIVFGGGGFDAPLFQGAIRGITIGSTTVSGGVVVTRFTST